MWKEREKVNPEKRKERKREKERKDDASLSLRALPYLCHMPSVVRPVYLSCRTSTPPVRCACQRFLWSTVHINDVISSWIFKYFNVWSTVGYSTLIYCTVISCTVQLYTILCYPLYTTLHSTLLYYTTQHHDVMF